MNLNNKRKKKKNDEKKYIKGREKKTCEKKVPIEILFVLFLFFALNSCLLSITKIYIYKEETEENMWKKERAC